MTKVCLFSGSNPLILPSRISTRPPTAFGSSLPSLTTRVSFHVPSRLSLRPFVSSADTNTAPRNTITTDHRVNMVRSPPDPRVTASLRGANPAPGHAGCREIGSRTGTPESSGAKAMPRRRPPTEVKKRLVFRQKGTSLYSVVPFGVRELSRSDEEFTNYAINEDFPGLIPKDEVWVSAPLVDREGLFFFADALARSHALAEGRSSDAAYDAGQEVERSLRTSIEGVEFHGGRRDSHSPREIYVEQYIVLGDDGRDPVTVWLIDGCLARCRYKTDYAEG